MSGIGPRNMGHGLTVALTRFVDTTIAPPSSPDPVLYRKGLQFFFRDTVGIEHPVAVGADGLGVVSIALADSPYDVQPTDRVLLVNTGDGAVTANLPADGGPFDGRPLLIVDAASNFATNNFTLDGNGQTINGSATLVFSTDDVGSALVWAGSEWIVVAGAGADATPAAHAASHRAGGGDDLLSAPGAIGGTTPAAGTFTTLTATASVNMPSGSLPATTAGTVKQYSGNGNNIVTVAGTGDKVSDRYTGDAGAGFVVRNVFTKSLADDASLDITLTASSKGGWGRVIAPGPMSSVSGLFSFAADATTSLNGATYTNVVATDTDTNLCVFASGGALRVRNRLGSTQNVMVEICELITV